MIGITGGKWEDKGRKNQTKIRILIRIRMKENVSMGGQVCGAVCRKGIKRKGLMVQWREEEDKGKSFGQGELRCRGLGIRDGRLDRRKKMVGVAAGVCVWVRVVRMVFGGTLTRRKNWRTITLMYIRLNHSK